jgi:hypothetical protein
MTIPIERSWALKNTRDFLYTLLDPKKTPRVSAAIRQQAYWCLKHFPADYEINKAAKLAPSVFEKLERYEDEIHS